MAQWRLMLGLLSATGLSLSGAALTVGCSSDKGSTGTPVNVAGAPTGGAAGAGGAATAGAGGSSAGSSGSGGSGGSGGAPGPTCSATPAATTVLSPYAITADMATGNVYWSNSSGTDACSNVIMMQAPGGMPTEVAKIDQTTADAGETNIAKSLALDAMGNIYYGAGYDLYRVKAMAGSVPTKVGTFDGKPTAIVPTATRIFTALDLDNAVQWRAPDPANSGCTDPISRPLAVSGESAAQMSARINGGGCAWAESIPSLTYESLWLSGKLLVFVDGANLDAADTTIAATAQAGHTQIAATDSFTAISGMTTIGDTAYFGEATGGIIEKAPVPSEQPMNAVTTPPTILLTDPTLLNPSSFVNDGKSVFFRTGASATDSCAVMQLPAVAGGISPAVAGGGASGSASAVQLAKVDACGTMNLAVGKNVLWYTDRAHNLVKSVAIPQ